MTGTSDQPPHPRHIDPLDGRPTLRARLLGTELRRVREAARLTVGELAALTDLEPDTIRQLETGIGPNVPRSESTVWCPWGTLTTSMINTLCRTAERIDIFAPLGIHPAIGPLDANRCTAYMLDEAVVDRRDVIVRVIRHEGRMYPGISHHALTRFTLPDGPAVVLYAYLHSANFTEEEEHLLAAYTLFDELAEFTAAA